MNCKKKIVKWLHIIFMQYINGFCRYRYGLQDLFLKNDLLISFLLYRS